MWNKVKVIGYTGTEFGIVSDSDGQLVLVFRNPGEDWPHGQEPSAGRNIIQGDCKSYIVMQDEN